MHDVRLRVRAVMIYGLRKLLFDTLFRLHNTFTIFRFFKLHADVFPWRNIMCALMIYGRGRTIVRNIVLCRFEFCPFESWVRFLILCVHAHMRVHTRTYTFFCRRRNWNVRETFFHWRKLWRRNPASELSLWTFSVSILLCKLWKKKKIITYMHCT